MSKVRVRFAPSPTGHLHLGGARTALFNWLFARRFRGDFILRVEDTDEVRSTPESVEAILGSLRWLGLDWDEGPTEPGEDGRCASKGEHGPYFQMERKDLYREAVDRLLADGKAYKCFCAKERLDAMRKEAQKAKRSPLYDRRCRGLTGEQRAQKEAEGAAYSVRFKMPEAGSTVVEDGVRGTVSFDNALLQDFVIQKSAGGPTYNFACVVDDHAMGMTHVIRADGHLDNTPLQLRVFEALGWEPPRFAHLSTILGPDGGKLSKRHGATSVLEYRDKGYLPETLRNYLALLGWSTSDSQQLFGPEELIEKFGLDGCQKNPATFDPVKLEWMNGEYLRKLDPERVLEQAMPFLEEAGLAGAPRERLLAAVALEREKYRLLTDVPKRVDFFFKDVVYEEKAVSKVLQKDGAGDVLRGLSEALAGLEAFDEKTLEERIRAFAAERDLKMGKVFHPLRVSVSGRTDGPTLFGMVELLGKETVLSRIQDALKLIAGA